MYLEHYSFTDFPFQLTPDHGFFFDSRPHRKAMAYLTYGLSKNEGFIVITGEIGSGKTTLINYLVSTIASQNTTVAHLVNTRIQADDLLRKVAFAFGIDAETASKAFVLDAIERFLVANHKAGRRTLLMVDEAQHLTPGLLEELRMLSNIQLGGRPLLQTCLSGQPEFRRTLSLPRLEQFRQRVVASYHLGPMEAADTRAYIEHRLRHVGWAGVPGFADDLFDVIFELTGGVPRKINFLCDRLLLYGYLEERAEFAAEDVRSIVAEMEEEAATFLPPEPEAPSAASPSESARPRQSISQRELDLVAQHLAFVEQLLAATVAARIAEDGATGTGGAGDDAVTGDDDGRVRNLMDHVAQLRKRLG